MFRKTSGVSLQLNDLICYDHTIKDLLTLVKNSDADLFMIQLSLKGRSSLAND